MADEGRKRKMQRKKGANLMKNLFKKIGALLVAAVMVLSMCTAVFADDTTEATITVKTPDGNALAINGENPATIWCIQVIEPDQTAETGWKFTTETVETVFKSNLGNVDAQTAIKMLANKAGQDAGQQSLKYANVGTATSAQFEAALAAVTKNATNTNKVSANPIPVTKAGVYAIKAAQDGYTYKEMAAYVGFSDSMTVTGNVDVAAKRSSKVIEKNVEETETDHVVAIGDVKTYTVKTEVPAFTPTDANKYFAVKDEITGAEYVKDGENVAVTVTVDGKPIKDYKIVMGTGNFTIILKDNRADKEIVDAKVKENNEPVINDSNSYYAKEVVVTYQATITDVTARNTAYGNVGSDKKSSTPVDLYTGTIKVIKKETNSKKLLPNAKFVVYRENNGKKEYAKLTKDGKLAGWTEAVNSDVKDDIKNGNTNDIGIIVTDAKGEATVSGLDLGKYYFEEVEAPTGYSLDATPNEVTVTLKENATVAKASTDVISNPINKYNTKLNSLPSTGGMGTYLFTIIGVVVMAGAAGAFFISRRKGSEE